MWLITDRDAQDGEDFYGRKSQHIDGKHDFLEYFGGHAEIIMQ